MNVLVTDSRKMAELNSRFRQKNAPTDVLSFPSGEREWAGDIAISAEIAQENARLLGHSLADEVKILVLHGFLHLAGYDHENKNDDGRMILKESQLRRELGLPAGLIERAAADKTPHKTAKSQKKKRQSSR